MASIARLSSAHTARFGEYVQHWSEVGLSTAPANRPLAEQGIRQAYGAAGLHAPHIVWCSSPLAMCLTRAIFLTLDQQSVLPVLNLRRNPMLDKLNILERATSAGNSDPSHQRLWAGVRQSVVDTVWGCLTRGFLDASLTQARYAPSNLVQAVAQTGALIRRQQSVLHPPFALRGTRYSPLLAGIDLGLVRLEVERPVRAQVWDQVMRQVYGGIHAPLHPILRDLVVQDFFAEELRRHQDDLVAPIGMPSAAYNNVLANVEAQTSRSVQAAVYAGLHDGLYAQLWTGIAGQIWEAIKAVGLRASSGSEYSLPWASLEEHMRHTVWGCGFGQHDASWMAFFAFFREVLGLEAQTDDLTGLRLIIENAGWYVPFGQICWVCERTSRVEQDDAGRLHCEDGPALSFPDGWSLYRWHGVAVPSWILEHPERINQDVLRGERNAEVHRVMLLKYGLERYLAEAGATELDSDRDTAGRRVLYSFADYLGTITMLQLENSTPEVTGEQKTYLVRVPPNTRTCAEAVAWMYGMQAGQYRPLVES